MATPSTKTSENQNKTHPPFGTYLLNRQEQTARNLAAKLKGKTNKNLNPDNTVLDNAVLDNIIFDNAVPLKITPSKIDKFIRSCLWRFVSGNSKRPRDVTVFDGQKIRLHPYDNICEKRVFMTPQFWENQERAILAHYINQHKEKNFTFIDAGANVGLYTFFVRSCTQRKNITLKALCIEPGPKVRQRLEFNIIANEAQEEITIAPFALGDKEGTVTFNIGDDNLGESRVLNHHGTDAETGMDKGQNEEKTISLMAKPLHTLLKSHQINTIDALKIDVEGQEYKTLKVFFDHANQHQKPKLIIIEIAHAKNHQNLMALLTTQNYQSVHKHRGNMVFALKP